MTINRKLLFIGAFLLTLWAPLLAALASDRFPHFARQLVANPTNFDSEREALRRSTPLWDGAVQVYNRALFALDTTQNRSVAVLGRDGWIFLGDIFEANFSQALGRRTFDDAHLQRWVRMLESQQRWLAERDIGFAFVVAPAKWSIHPDKLPSWAPVGVTHPIDRLLAERPVTVMPDLRPALRQANAQAATFSPLNSHWTEYGGWVAWRQIAAALESALPRTGPYFVPAIAGTRVASGNNEFAGMLSLHIDNPWTHVDLGSPLPEFEIESDDGSVRAVAGSSPTDLLDLPRKTRNPNATSPHRVLWLRDSSGNSLSPFVQSTFAASMQVDHALAYPLKSADLKALVEQYQPDLVIWLIAERYLLSPIPDDSNWLRPEMSESHSNPPRSP